MNSKYSFRNGWSQVKQGDARAVKSKVMEVLGVNTRAGFHVRLNGMIEPKISEYNDIERVFAEYGITDVWGPVRGITQIQEAV